MIIAAPCRHEGSDGHPVATPDRHRRERRSELAVRVVSLPVADSRKPTPSGTPSLQPPPPSSGRHVRGAALVPPVRLLTPAGSFELNVDEAVVVGRCSSCDLVLEDPLASRRHILIVASRDQVDLEDLKSRNGVYVNCVRVEHDVRLHEGDRIVLGTTELSIFSTQSS